MMSEEQKRSAHNILSIQVEVDQGFAQYFVRVPGRLKIILNTPYKLNIQNMVIPQSFFAIFCYK